MNSLTAKDCQHISGGLSALAFGAIVGTSVGCCLFGCVSMFAPLALIYCPLMCAVGLGVGIIGGLMSGIIAAGTYNG